MKILFIGDIVGIPARKVVKDILADIKRDYSIDFTIANGEHLSNRVGVDASVVEDMHKSGIDFFTTGNHVWREKSFAEHIGKDNMPVIRPANYPKDTPGEGYRLVETNFGNILIINLLGKEGIKANVYSPFETVDKLLEDVKDLDYKYSLVDFHAEFSSEKVALGRYLDGRVSAVVGTHIHVPTADAKVLKNGTAVITDVGYTGPSESVLGVKEEISYRFLTSGLPTRFEIADGPVQFNAVVIDIGQDGKARSIERVDRIIEV